MTLFIPKFKVRKSPIVASVTPVTLNSSFVELASACENSLKNQSPVPCEDGINGTMFLRGADSDGFIAVLKTNNGEEDKPSQLERKGVGSPQIECGEHSDHGINSEEAAVRELAAYRLDSRGFYGVPSTGLVQIEYSGFPTGEIVANSPVVVRRRYGSLQRFKVNDGSAEDVGFSLFPVKEVHKIAILDIQILNADRHDGNILFKRTPNNGFQLIPIDHGYSLPHKLDKCWFGWLTWPQVKIPFSSEELEYIRSIDIQKDSEILRELQVSPDCIFNMKLSVTLLKKGAESGLNLYDIGAMICRVNGAYHPSDLESILQQSVCDSSVSDEEKVLEIASRWMDERIVNVLEKKKKWNTSSSNSKNLLRNISAGMKEKVEPCIVPLSPRLAAKRRVCNPRSPLASPLSLRRLCL